MASPPTVCLAVATLCVLVCHAHAYVTIDSNRLASELKYWLCSADGETGDILLHVMAEQTIQESAAKKAAATCATFAAAIKAVDAAAASRAWLPAEQEDGAAKSWTGCSNTKCPADVKGTSTALKLAAPTYVRLLEFGHEQAGDCEDASAAIDTFVANLVKAGCGGRVCSIMDYVAARPVQGCKAI